MVQLRERALDLQALGAIDLAHPGLRRGKTGSCFCYITSNFCFVQLIV